MLYVSNYTIYILSFFSSRHKHRNARCEFRVTRDRDFADAKSIIMLSSHRREILYIVRVIYIHLIMDGPSLRRTTPIARLRALFRALKRRKIIFVNRRTARKKKKDKNYRERAFHTRARNRELAKKLTHVLRPPLISICVFFFFILEIPRNRILELLLSSRSKFGNGTAGDGSLSNFDRDFTQRNLTFYPSVDIEAPQVEVDYHGSSNCFLFSFFLIHRSV